MEWPFWILIVLSPFTLLGVAVTASFACGLFSDPNKQPASNPKDAWE